MKPLSAFEPWIAPHAFGAPVPLMHQMLVDTCIDFCSRTNLIQTVDVQDVFADIPDYSASAPSYQELSSVLQVMLDSQPLTATAVDDVLHGAAMRAGIDTVVAPMRGTPNTFYQTTPTSSTINLWPVPDRNLTGALAIRASWKPVRKATFLADELFDSYVYPITCGTAYRLLMMPGQPFTNPAGAKVLQGEYEGAVSSAAADARKGDVRAGRYVKPRPFA